jgi:hypothetical protein
MGSELKFNGPDVDKNDKYAKTYIVVTDDNSNTIANYDSDLDSSRLISIF